MSSQMLCSKEPLSAPRLGAGMLPGHEDARRQSPTAGIALSCQRVDYEEVYIVRCQYLWLNNQQRGHEHIGRDVEVPKVFVTLVWGDLFCESCLQSDWWLYHRLLLQPANQKIQISWYILYCCISRPDRIVSFRSLHYHVDDPSN